MLCDCFGWWCGEPGLFVVGEVLGLWCVGLLWWFAGSQGRPAVLVVVVLLGLLDLIAEVPRLGEWTGVRRRKGCVGVALDWAMGMGCVLYWNWTGRTLCACLTVVFSLGYV